jgi:predicted amidohydrolase YtcJ
MNLSLGALLTLTLLQIGCASEPPAAAPGPPAADIVFYGEHILTLDESTRGATAVAVRGDSIVSVGTRPEVAALVGSDTRVVELGERALVPGFMDAHGHLALVMMEIDFVNVSSHIVALLKDRIEERDLAPGEWVIGFGYDDSLVAEGRHPTRDDLDRVSTEHPILLLHVSHHLSAANSAALAASGIGPDSEDPPGGVIRRRPGTNEPNGVLEETATHALFGAMPRDTDPAAFATSLARAVDYHASFGITTIQDGASDPNFLKAVRAVAAQAPLAVDVAAFPTANAMPLEAPVEDAGYSREYVNGLRVAGVKFVLDGSPQGRTAWLTEPYDEGPPGAPADYVAYPIADTDHYRAKVGQFIQAGIPVIVHANGDAAVDMMMDGVEQAIGDERPDHRSVTIHAQVTRPDQLDRMKDLGVIPSFFSAHTFFWGDWHRESFGDKRASHTSPLGGALRRDLPFTIHNDAPVVPPHVLRLIEIAVERRTRSGYLLGPDQRVSVEQALHAVTLGTAYAYFEEDQKGSITPGKRADLVILGQDPREVPSSEISEIEVVETLARGRSVFRSVSSR